MSKGSGGTRAKEYGKKMVQEIFRVRDAYKKRSYKEFTDVKNQLKKKGIIFD